MVVTHDRYLVNRLADRILHLTKNGLTEYIGGYDDYLEAVRNIQTESGRQEKKLSANAAEYKEKKALKSEQAKARTAVSRAEKAIKEAEEELESINFELALPYIASDYKKAGELSKKADGLRERIEKLYAEWEDAEARLAELNNTES